MPDVVLLHEGSCPNVSEARANLRRAFSTAGMRASWRELDVDGPETPQAWRSFGSPAVLVDGVDVGGGAPGDGATCRLYEADGHLVRAPSVDSIVARLRAVCGAPPRSPRSGGRAAIAAVPGVALALLPNVVCPACWPASAAVLSAMGVWFLIQARYLLPITIVFVAVGIVAIGYGARSRRGYLPAVVAGLAGLTMIVAKFVVSASLVAYTATLAFAAAATWNAWPARRRAAACPTCVQDGPPRKA